MIGRVALALVVAAGCAAAVPAVHGSLPHHAAHASSPADHAEMRRRLDAALDALALAPDVRAAADAVFRAHQARAEDLVRRLRAGELDQAAARAEHDAIVASAKSELRPILTEEQIDELERALHPR